MDIIILLVLVFIVWKTMKFAYDAMNKKIETMNKDKNTEIKDDNN